MSCVSPSILLHTSSETPHTHRFRTQMGSRRDRQHLQGQRIHSADGLPGDLQRDPAQRRARALPVSPQVRDRVLRVQPAYVSPSYHLAGAPWLTALLCRGSCWRILHRQVPHPPGLGRARLSLRSRTVHGSGASRLSFISVALIRDMHLLNPILHRPTASGTGTSPTSSRSPRSRPSRRSTTSP